MTTLYPAHPINSMNPVQTATDDSLMQLVYISRISWWGLLNPKTLANIKRVATVNNAQHGITGILCYGNGCFLQCIEGQKEEVLALKDNLCRTDKRHKQVQIHQFTPIDSRHFQGWSMRLLYLERWLLSKDYKSELATLNKFMPFKPFDWNQQQWEEFLNVITNIDKLPQPKPMQANFNAIGKWLSAIAAPHQAFLVVQSTLLLCVIVSVIFLFY